MYCKHCGKEIDDTSTFCQHCGKKIEEEPINIKVQENYTTAIEKEDKKNKIFTATIITIIAIVLLIGIILFLKATKNRLPKYQFNAY